MQTRPLAALLAAAAAVGVVHCSSDEKKTEDQQPAASGRVGGVGQPPAPPKGAPAAAGAGVVIAMSKIWAGETDREFVAKREAWKEFGHNVDGVVSTPGAPGHCLPRDFGLPEEIQEDGPNGLDNSFAQNVLYRLSSIAKNVSFGITRAIDLGQVTFLVDLRNLDGTGSQAGVDTRLYGGGFRLFDGQAPGTIYDAHPDSVTEGGLVILPDGAMVDPICQYCEAPTWAEDEAWPVVYETVQGGDVDKAVLSFPDGYVVDGTYVVQPKAAVTLTIPLRGVALELEILVPLISFEIEGTGPDTMVMKGVISGVLEAEGMFATFKRAAGAIDPGLCGPIGLLRAPLLAAADIMQNGKQAPDVMCDAVSIGIGFEGRPMKLGELTDPSPPASDVCN